MGFCKDCSERMNGVGVLSSPNDSVPDGKGRCRKQQQQPKHGGATQKPVYQSQSQPQLRGVPSPSLSSPSSWSSEFEESSESGDSTIRSASPVEENFHCVRCMARFTRSSGSSAVLCRRCSSS